MLEENQIIENDEIESGESEIDEVLDKSTSIIPLDEQQEKIAQNIITAPTQEELQQQFDLFNITQSKKNALRVIKLNNLLDKVEDQAIERFEKRPDQVSNRELLDYMQVVSNQIDRSQKYIDTLKDKPLIKATQNNTEVNINIGTELNRESKERVVDAIQSLLKQFEKNKAEQIIDVESSVSEETDENDKNIVYNDEYDSSESGD